MDGHDESIRDEFTIDLDDWLDRAATGSERNAPVEAALDNPPDAATTPHLTEVNGRRQLAFLYSLSLWRAR